MKRRRSSPPKRSSWGGRRAGAGGRPGNRNAVKFKAVGLPDSLDLHTREGLVEYIIRVIGHFASGLADARREGTHSQWVKLLADINGWIPKAPLQIVKQQAQGLVDEEQIIKAMQEMIREMPDHMRMELWDIYERQQLAKAKLLPPARDHGSSKSGS